MGATGAKGLDAAPSTGAALPGSRRPNHLGVLDERPEKRRGSIPQEEPRPLADGRKSTALKLQSRDVGPQGSLEPDHRVDHVILDLGPALFVTVAADLQAVLDALFGRAIVLAPLQGAAEVVRYGFLGGLERVEGGVVLVVAILARSIRSSTLASCSRST